MAPASSFTGSNNQLVVAWDLDTTGRRLIDEICQIGAYYIIPSSADGVEEMVFSQYVMPYRNPNPGARRSFGIKVVNVGRYRMLKDMNSGKILKTKSEVSALQDFIEWLEEGRKKAQKDGVLLACHEVHRKVLVPLLLEGIHKYNLNELFEATVKGFINGVNVVESLGSKDTITSNSLRSLCKTVLGDINPDTISASDRSKVLVRIMAKICADSVKDGGDKPADANGIIDAPKLIHVATTVSEEVSKLKHLKGMLDTQGTLRPIFEQQLKQKRSVRDRAMTLRRLVAESGMDYKTVEGLYLTAKSSSTEEEDDNKLDQEFKLGLQANIPDAVDEDLDELVTLCKEHFSITHCKKDETADTTDKSSSPNVTNNKRYNNYNNRRPYNTGRYQKPAGQRSKPQTNKEKPPSNEAAATDTTQQESAECANKE